MKKLMLLLLMLTPMLTLSAEGIRYFTYSQVSRTVSYLNAQNELMIYCGYADEVETYVLLNEVWAEKVNSRYYEIWIFGYDGYTGEEIYMPIDLECIWLPGTNAGYYNAAQYLRFHTNIATPSVVWYIPAYNHYSRVPHVAGHPRTYQWDIHRRGWQRPAWDYRNDGPAPYPPYYMRDPRTPVPQTHGQAWTPGVNRPTVPSNGYGTVDGQGTRPSQGHNSGIRNAAGTVSTNTSRNTGSGRGSNTRGSNSGNGSGVAGSSSRSTGTTSRSSNSSSSSSRNSSTSNSGNSSRGTNKTTNTAGSSSRSTGSTSGNASRNTGSGTSRSSSTGSSISGSSSRGTTSTSGSSTGNANASRSSNATNSGSSSRGTNKTTNTSSSSSRSTGSTSGNASRSTGNGTSRSSSTGSSVSGSSSRGTTSTSSTGSRSTGSTRTTNR